MNVLPKSEEGRFWAKVDRGEPEACWPWTASRTQGGYGLFQAGSKTDDTARTVLAHRWAFESFHGPLPPDACGLKRTRELDHQCRNPLCVNPDHLELVTRWENNRRSQSPSAQNARKTRCPQGHRFTEENTYRYRGERHCRACDRSRHRRKGNAQGPPA